MNESTLLKLSFVFSILGILIILFISETSSIELYKISDITNENLDKNVKIIGTIRNIIDTPEILITNIEDDSGTITIAIFKEENLVLEKHWQIEVIGKVTEYKDQLEIIADQVKVI
jgi:RecJ-like exonuclease